jgi:hypothetical protein
MRRLLMLNRRRAFELDLMSMGVRRRRKGKGWVACVRGVSVSVGETVSMCREGERLVPMSVSVSVPMMCVTVSVPMSVCMHARTGVSWVQNEQLRGCVRPWTRGCAALDGGGGWSGGREGFVRARGRDCADDVHHALSVTLFPFPFPFPLTVAVIISQVPVPVYVPFAIAVSFAWYFARTLTQTCMDPVRPFAFAKALRIKTVPFPVIGHGQ